MEKLIIEYMRNPSKQNLDKVFVHDRKHMMAVCLLPMNMQVIFNQLKREFA